MSISSQIPSSDLRAVLPSVRTSSAIQVFLVCDCWWWWWWWEELASSLVSAGPQESRTGLRQRSVSNSSSVGLLRELAEARRLREEQRRAEEKKKKRRTSIQNRKFSCDPRRVPLLLKWSLGMALLLSFASIALLGFFYNFGSSPVFATTEGKEVSSPRDDSSSCSQSFVFGGRSVPVSMPA